MPEAQITWPQLFALMALGEDPEPGLRGVVRARLSIPAEDDEPADLEVPGHGRYRIDDSRVRVFKRDNLVRREHLDGRPLAIEGADTLWVWEGDSTVPTAIPRRSALWAWADSPVTQRRPIEAWHDADFTKAAGAPTRTTFLGRDVWEVELRPPPHKPFPLTLVVDAATGLVLSQRNDGFHALVEWEEVEFDVDLPASLFEWEGPSQPPPDHRAEHEAEMALRREWLEQHDVGPLAVTLPVELMLHEWDRDGGFHASLLAALEGSLARRQQSEEPWDLFMNWPHMYRWTSGGWDWWLGTSQPVDAPVLDALKAQLDR